MERAVTWRYFIRFDDGTELALEPASAGVTVREIPRARYVVEPRMDQRDLWECDGCNSRFWDTAAIHVPAEVMGIGYVQCLCPFCGGELQLIPDEPVVVEKK